MLREILASKYSYLVLIYINATNVSLCNNCHRAYRCARSMKYSLLAGNSLLYINIPACGQLACGRLRGHAQVLDDVKT